MAFSKIPTFGQHSGHQEHQGHKSHNGGHKNDDPCERRLKKHHHKKHHHKKHHHCH